MHVPSLDPGIIHRRGITAAIHVLISHRIPIIAAVMHRQVHAHGSVIRDIHKTVLMMGRSHLAMVLQIVKESSDKYYVIPVKP